MSGRQPTPVSSSTGREVGPLDTQVLKKLGEAFLYREFYFGHHIALRVRHTGRGFLQLSGELSALPDPTPVQFQILVIHLNAIAIRVTEVKAH
jgi:hypothetical protein